MNKYVRGLIKFEPLAGSRGVAFQRWQDKRGVIRQTMLCQAGSLADMDRQTDGAREKSSLILTRIADADSG